MHEDMMQHLTRAPLHVSWLDLNSQNFRAALALLLAFGVFLASCFTLFRILGISATPTPTLQFVFPKPISDLLLNEIEMYIQI
jgi:hypothetical protein